MNAVLESLIGSEPEIEAAAFVRGDGAVESSTFRSKAQESRIGAMAAAIVDVCNRASAEIGRGEPTEVAIAGADGYVAIVSAKDDRYLVCATSLAADVRTVLATMRVVVDSSQTAGECVSPAQQG
ncbi:MAG: hypothetical protein HGA39_06925 [Coriobacteriia bacterium]|nr:hypothetical protein [Coriobacteriia bacterium]